MRPARRQVRDHGVRRKPSCKTSASVIAGDVGDPHHLAPLLGFSGDEGSELRGIERHRHRAEIGEPRLDRRLRQHGADLTLEACDDGRGRTLGRAYAGPGPCLVYPGNASAIVGTSGPR